MGYVYWHQNAGSLELKQLKVSGAYSAVRMPESAIPMLRIHPFTICS
jgi:hypothetical protein